VKVFLKLIYCSQVTRRLAKVTKPECWSSITYHYDLISLSSNDANHRKYRIANTSLTALDTPHNVVLLYSENFTTYIGLTHLRWGKNIYDRYTQKFLKHLPVKVFLKLIYYSQVTRRLAKVTKAECWSSITYYYDLISLSSNDANHRKYRIANTSLTALDTPHNVVLLYSENCVTLP